MIRMPCLRQKPESMVLTWTVNGCESNIRVETTNCNEVDFDGGNDYVDFGDNLIWEVKVLLVYQLG